MLSDEELMLAVGRGNLEALGQLTLRYQTEAWRVAYRFVGDGAEAEDLVQEAFLRLLDAAPRYKPTAMFRTYFYRVLTRICLDYHRKKKPVTRERLPDTVDDMCGPEQEASRSEREKKIQTALNSLTSDYRMAIVLRYFEGMSGAEMALAMGRSVKSVERLLARARGTLEKELGYLSKD